MVIGTVDSCVYCFRSMINTRTWWFIQVYVLSQASDQHMNMVIFLVVHIVSGLWSNDEWSTPGLGGLSSFGFCSRPVNNTRTWRFIQLCPLFQVYGQHLNMVIYPVVCTVPGLWPTSEHGARWCGRDGDHCGDWWRDIWGNLQSMFLTSSIQSRWSLWTNWRLYKKMESAAWWLHVGPK